MNNLIKSNLEAKAFKRFLKLLPHGKEPILVILKGHLLIEERLRTIIDNQFRYTAPVKKARLSCSQIIYLAEAFFGSNNESWFWSSLRSLNTLRNDIAHNLESEKINVNINKISLDVGNNSIFSNGGFGDADGMSRFELSLWVLFVKTSSLESSNEAGSRGRTR